MCSESVTINNKKLFYYETGIGFPIVLLHGYLENNYVWSEFAILLSKKYRIICPDLPGHGKSEPFEQQTVEKMANSIYELLKYLKIKKTILIGHSMGGYITLAFAEHYAQLLNGFCLFHSHPFADNNDKKHNRLQEIELVRKGKQKLIIQSAISKMFASKFFEQNKPFFDKSLEIALSTTQDGMIACINSMIERSDKTTFITNCNIPVLWISGKYDEYFSFKEMLNFAIKNKNIQTEILESSGHMGMVEEPLKALEIIENFAQKIID